MPNKYADIILPVAVKGRFTYSIPDYLASSVKPGVRAIVQFGNKRLYSGIVCRIHDEAPVIETIRPLKDIPDPVPVVNEIQLRFWKWLSDYYMCTEGEVMNAAVPSAMFPEGNTSVPVIERYKPREETFIILARQFSDEELNGILDKLK